MWIQTLSILLRWWMFYERFVLSLLPVVLQSFCWRRLSQQRQVHPLVSGSYVSARSRSRQGAELRFIRLGCVRCSGEAAEPTCFSPKRKKKSSVTSLINTRELKGLRRPRRRPQLGTVLLNLTTMEFKNGDAQGPQLRETSPSGFLFRLQSRAESGWKLQQAGLKSCCSQSCRKLFEIILRLNLLVM